MPRQLKCTQKSISFSVLLIQNCRNSQGCKYSQSNWLQLNFDTVHHYTLKWTTQSTVLQSCLMFPLLQIDLKHYCQKPVLWSWEKKSQVWRGKRTGTKAAAIVADGDIVWSWCNSALYNAAICVPVKKGGHFPDQIKLPDFSLTVPVGQAKIHRYTVYAMVNSHQLKTGQVTRAFRIHHLTNCGCRCNSCRMTC